MSTTTVDSRREQLLYAAARTFMTAGYAATRVSDIVSEAGVAQGTFYLYFRSKREVFRQLVERFLTMLIDEVISAPFDEPTDLDEFRHIGRARVLIALRTCSENRELSRIFFREALGSDPDLNARVLEFNQLVAQSTEAQLRDGIRRGYLRPHNTHVVSIALVGLFEQVIRNLIVFSDEEVDLESLADDLVDFELHGLGARNL